MASSTILLRFAPMKVYPLRHGETPCNTGNDRDGADAVPDDFVDNPPMHRHRGPAVHNETGEGLR